MGNRRPPEALTSPLLPQDEKSMSKRNVWQKHLQKGNATGLRKLLSPQQGDTPGRGQPRKGAADGMVPDMEIKLPPQTEKA